MAAGKIAFKCVAYLNGATFGSPSWTAITAISDWTVDPSWDWAEHPTRASRMKLGLKTLLGLDISGKLRNSDSGDANYTTILAALLTDATVDMMILNGPNTQTGVFGWRCEFQLIKGTEDQGLNQVVNDQVNFKPAITVNLPQSALVSGGVAGFTSI